MRLVPAALILLAGCSAAENPSADVTVIGDTTVVTNHAALWRQPRTMRPVMRIGMPDGPNEYLFETIVAFAVDPANNVVISDVEPPVRLFDSTGKFVRVVARHGQGPGEALEPRGLAIMPDGGVVLRDQGNGRLNFYSADGGPRTQWRLPQMSGYGAHTVTVDSAGNVYITVNPVFQADGTPQRWPRPVYYRLDDSGRVVDTISAPARFTEKCPVLSNSHFRAGWFEDIRWTFIPKVTWALAPNGDLAVGCPAAESFDVMHADGRVTRVVWHWPAVRATRGERDQFRQGVQLTQRQVMKNWQWTGPGLPDIKPPYLRILPNQDGGFWLWRSRKGVRERMPAGAPPELGKYWWKNSPSSTFDVFRQDGRYLGEVHAPDNLVFEGHPGTADPLIRGDTVWAVTHDSLDVEYLTRFELTPME